MEKAEDEVEYNSMQIELDKMKKEEEFILN